MRNQYIIIGSLAVCLASLASAMTAISFDSALAGVNQHSDTGVDGSYVVSSDGLDFGYQVSFGGLSWSGLVASTETDTSKAQDFTAAQYVAMPGTGSVGTGYAVIATGTEFVAPFDPATYRIEFDDFAKGVSLDVTNTVYGFYSMQDGSFTGGFPTQNGAFDGNEDFFTLTLTGIDAFDQPLGTISFDLGRGTDLVDTWETLDLSSLGTMKALDVSFAWSDSFLPAFVAMDNLTFTSVIPEPSAVGFLAGGLGLMVALRRRR